MSQRLIWHANISRVLFLFLKLFQDKIQKNLQAGDIQKGPKICEEKLIAVAVNGRKNSRSVQWVESVKWNGEVVMR